MKLESTGRFAASISDMLMKACRLKPLRPTEDLVEVGSIVSEILFDLRIFNHVIANKGGQLGSPHELMGLMKVHIEGIYPESLEESHPPG